MTIDAPNRGAAMDWCLVLTSQGIESELHFHPDSRIWFLLVDRADGFRARTEIEKFQRENAAARWDWRYPIPRSRTVFHPGGFLWCLFLIWIYFLDVHQNGGLRDRGMMDGQALFSTGAWWRLITAQTLHADLTHLISNVSTGFLFLGIIMGRFGYGNGLLGALLAGAAGNLFAASIYPDPYLSLGASSTIMATLGMMTTHAFGLLRSSRRRRKLILPIIGACVLLFALTGFSPESDLLAHVGGYLFGLPVGFFLSHRPPAFLINPKSNRASLLLFIFILIVSWTLAFKP